jgi:hypothetical protein
MSTTIQYEVTLTVSVPAGQHEDEPRPFEGAFYAPCAGSIEITRARRITTPVAMGGPR